MSEPKGPAGYIEKLLFAQRVVRSARFRNDQKMAVRELSEGVYELIAALLEREQGHEAPPGGGTDQGPTP